MAKLQGWQDEGGEHRRFIFSELNPAFYELRIPPLMAELDSVAKMKGGKLISTQNFFNERSTGSKSIYKSFSFHHTEKARALIFVGVRLFLRTPIIKEKPKFKGIFLWRKRDGVERKLNWSFLMRISSSDIDAQTMQTFVQVLKSEGIKAEIRQDGQNVNVEWEFSFEREMNISDDKNLEDPYVAEEVLKVALSEHTGEISNALTTSMEKLLQILLDRRIIALY